MTRLAVGSILSWVLVAAAGDPASAREPVAPVAGDVTRDDVMIEAREEQARAACSSGRLQEGASILTELFAKTDDGNYLFNLARCYQHNGRKDEALMRFRAYLGRPDGDPPAVAAARQYVAELERPPQPSVVAREVPSSPPPARVWSRARTLRMAGLFAGGIGLAALGTGTYFAVRTHRIQEQQDDAVRAGNSDPGFYEDLNERGDRAERLQWIFLGVGAAAVSASGVLYYLGLREPSGHEVSLLVMPVAPGKGGGAMLRGVF